MNKCIFLDRDGVINKDYVDYAYSLDKFIILDGVLESLQKLKEAGFKLAIITNQSGIAKGVYTREDMQTCHDYLQEQCGGIIDEIQYAPYHPIVTESLTRKPNSLMFEKAISKLQADISQSWMLGDKERDLIPAKKLGIKSILVEPELQKNSISDYQCNSLIEAVKTVILK
jgi:D-glycero-D-manno-heptose 1,7-bisphosphate phosphatase